MVYLYPAALAVISLLTVVLEAVFPRRRDQRQLRRGLFTDLLHLIFNGHFLGVILYGIAHAYVMPALEGVANSYGRTLMFAGIAANWPLWLQIVVALVVIDFLQWVVHVLLHRLPFLWHFHQTHHSVVDGEMDWIVSFRFHWMEVVIYRSLLYLPLALFGFHPTAVMVHAIFGTLIGHLNHANLDWDYGPLRYVFNNPRMHLWHHDFEGGARTTKNFGIIFSTWDFVFGTAKLERTPPAKLGFPGVEDHPRDFLSVQAWPLSALFRGKKRLIAMAAGAALLAAGWWLHAPKAAATPDRDAAIASFGTQAKADGFAHPEVMVSARELASAVGSERLALIDVRPLQRFADGHLPGAQPISRKEIERAHEGVVVSKSRAELEALLRARGARRGQEIVLYGDGSEPYRLWWTLATEGGLRVRVLDGGIQGWKNAGYSVVTGLAPAPEPGDVVLSGVHGAAPKLWSEILAAADEGAIFLDARSPEEYSGDVQHAGAARAGHIPDAQNLPWTDLLRDPENDPRLRRPAELRELFSKLGIDGTRMVVTYCQTGTRSSVAYFALHQLGFSVRDALNYEGSWAEYSRLEGVPR